MGQQFRLAGLLRFRQAQEEQAAAALARANGRNREQQDRVNRVLGTLAAGPSDAGTAAALRASAAARASARSMLLELAGLTAAAAQEAAAAADALSAAKKSTASLEKLAERHDADGRQELLRNEQLFLDELASSRMPAAGLPGTGGQP